MMRTVKNCSEEVTGSHPACKGIRIKYDCYNRRVGVYPGNGSLLIENLRAEDAGRYMVVMTAFEVRVTSIITLIVMHNSTGTDGGGQDMKIAGMNAFRLALAFVVLCFCAAAVKVYIKESLERDRDKMLAPDKPAASATGADAREVEDDSRL
ncbi:uncharacterized protein LOC106703914 [Latimeria chalumnae]|uniref:uncharacterized protein LOC106703914 n=1 Tax=Latimeria chalumnae TaxID=7897 RepID=UPI0006D8DED0|nr:PREDICTED: uncharacterized protein LOC106703914 [Latimeria chalumnae]|eukprot:XP_014345228.1 PREDICTED: uncharacterized protein LOC106703914 [Latimeria chalumnae]